jgi:ribosomal protein S18 acetylase RimI-like enzyme
MTYNLKIKDIYGGMKQNAELFAKVVCANFKDIQVDSALVHDDDEIKKLIKSNTMYTAFAYDGDVLIGYLIGEIINNNLCFHIGYLYVMSSYRCHGVASILMQTMNDKMKNSYSINKITLTCNINNTHNFNFYTKKGFRIDKLYMKTNNYCVMSTNL